MRIAAAPSTRNIMATVNVVRPLMGLAYLADDDRCEWTITKSTKGSRVDALRPGQRVRLVVQNYSGFCLVQECAPEDF